MFGVGHTELLVIMFVALILFGHRLPSTMRSMGLGVSEFRRGLASTSNEDHLKDAGDRRL